LEGMCVFMTVSDWVRKQAFHPRQSKPRANVE
jgi:hypothetical protein